MGLAKSGPKPYLWTHDRRFPHIRRLYRPSHLSRRGCGRPAPDGGGVVRAGLVAAVPFRGQEMRFSPADRERFRRVLAEADSVEVLAPAYHRGCYAVRNNCLVDRAALLVAWYDGSAGGTQYTVRRALMRGREVWNLHPAALVPVQPVPRLF